MPPQAWGALVGLGIFVAGLIYHAGRMAARVDALEAWRLELRADFLQLRNSLEQIKGLIRGEDD
jgi:hypothetical protein